MVAHQHVEMEVLQETKETKGIREEMELPEETVLQERQERLVRMGHQEPIKLVFGPRELKPLTVQMDAAVLVAVLVAAVDVRPVLFAITVQEMADLAAAAAAKVVKAVKAVMALEVLLEFILTTTVLMVTFGIVSFKREQQELVVLEAMAVLAATEERAEVFKLRVLQKLVTVVPEVPVALEEQEEREAMEPME